MTPKKYDILPQQDIAIIASKARTMEELAFRAHAFNHVNTFPTEMTIF